LCCVVVFLDKTNFRKALFDEHSKFLKDGKSEDKVVEEAQ